MLAELRAALAALVFATAALASEQSVVVDDVRVTVSMHWPDALNKGWFPASVRVENPTANDRDVDLVFECGMGPASEVVERDMRVPAGRAEQFEILLPARSHFQNAYTLRIRAGERGFLGGIGATQPCQPHERTVLVASRAGPSAVDVARLATDLSAESDPRVPADAKGGGGRMRHIGYVGVPTPVAAGATAAVPEHVRVHGIAYENLSAQHEAYTSLHALVLDVGENATPTRGVLDAIEAWTRAGGVLAVTGRGARAFVAKEPALAAWAEPRFQVGGSEGDATYVCALGLLVVLEGESSPLAIEQVVRLNSAIERRAPFGEDPPHSAFELDVPGIDVPYRSLTLILVLFALLVGPVNLILVRRSKRPVLLLFTIPAIAIAFSVGLVGYGALAQGLDVRATSASVGVLDQRSHHGSSHERRRVFAGLAVGAGLQPGPGCVIERPPTENVSWSDRREYRTTYGRVLTLSGAWMPVRAPTDFQVGLDRAARARIDFEKTADGWKLSNGLEATVTNLVFRDAEGNVHAFEGPIVRGRSLVEVGDVQVATRVFARFAAAGPLAAPVADGDLPRGTWFATVEGTPLVDPCGLEYDEVRSDHVLLGVLELAEAR